MNNKKYIKIIYFLLTNNCNSKCVTCDYWKNRDGAYFDKGDILKILKYLSKHGLDTVIFSGGEPLLDKNIFSICREIKHKFPLLQLRLLTNGLLLSKYANEVSDCFDVVVVSLDASNKDVYKKIRGVYGFGLVVDGIKSLRMLNNKLEIRIRCVIQKDNYKSIPDIIKLTTRLGVDKLSFLPVDIHSIESFSRKNKKSSGSNLILNYREVSEFEKIIKGILDSKKVAEVLINQGKDLKKIYNYYFSISKKLKFPPIKCNVPSFSLAIDNKLDVYACFFGKKIANIREMGGIEKIFGSKRLADLRKNSLRKKLQCRKCVSPEFIDPAHFIK